MATGSPFMELQLQLLFCSSYSCCTSHHALLQQHPGLAQLPDRHCQQQRQAAGGGDEATVYSRLVRAAAPS